MREMMADSREVTGSSFYCYAGLDERLNLLHERVREMRSVGKLNAAALKHLQRFFKIKGIYTPTPSRVIRSPSGRHA